MNGISEHGGRSQSKATSFKTRQDTGRPGVSLVEEHISLSSEVIVRASLGETPPLSVCGQVRFSHIARMSVDDIAKELKARGTLPDGKGDMLTAVEFDSPEARTVMKAMRLMVSDRVGKRLLRAAAKSALEARTAGGPDLTIYDIDVRRICDHRQLLRALHHLCEIRAVPFDKRLSRTEALGFWFVDTVRQLKRTLSVPGAQILAATDKEGNLWGMLIYHLEPGEFSPDDRMLVRAAGRKKAIPDGEACGIAHIVAVDPRIGLSPAQGGLGIDGRQLFSCMHACMVLEARRKGLDWLLAYVRTAPNGNRAISAHLEMGWEAVRGCTFALDYKRPFDNSWDTVKNRVLRLNLRTDLQDQVIAAARRARFVRYRDLDPE